MSKEFFWFNEDTNNVQDFYFNDWEHSSEQVDDTVIVGVISFKQNYKIIFQCIFLLDYS